MARISATLLAEPSRRLLSMGLGSPDRRQVDRGCNSSHAVDRGRGRGEFAKVFKKETPMILSPDFCDHYKTKILLRLAGHAGVFSLLKLWSQCQFRKCERIEKPAAIVAAIADWTGDPDQLENALVESGYARREGDALVLHQWQDQNKRLFSNYKNGKKGGRPKNDPPKPTKKPVGMRL